MKTDRAARLKQRDHKVIHLFRRLKNTKYKGVPSYSNERIMHTLSVEFSLSERTIEKIIYGRAKYKSASV